jgi:hypothetical protein
MSRASLQPRTLIYGHPSHLRLGLRQLARDNWLEDRDKPVRLNNQLGGKLELVRR